MYQREIKILKQEKAFLIKREENAFKRFLDRCKDAYDQSWIGMIDNPFKGVKWTEEEEILEESEKKVMQIEQKED